MLLLAGAINCYSGSRGSHADYQLPTAPLAHVPVQSRLFSCCYDSHNTQQMTHAILCNHWMAHLWTAQHMSKGCRSHSVFHSGPHLQHQHSTNNCITPPSIMELIEDALAHAIKHGVIQQRCKHDRPAHVIIGSQV
jgi:hypothetical protein